MIASPLGFLNIPMNDRMKPMNQTKKLTPGNQLNIKLMKDSTNPAVPTPLDCRCSTDTFTEAVDGLPLNKL